MAIAVSVLWMIVYKVDGFQVSNVDQLVENNQECSRSCAIFFGIYETPLESGIIKKEIVLEALQ